MKLYQIIYADPPWRYESGPTHPRNDVERHYPTMDLEDIKALDIPAADNCILFMWATAPKLSEALEVVKAWGFNYRSCCIWDKERMGVGYYTRIQHEILLIAKKGTFPCPPFDQRPKSIYREERGRHSRKPPYYRQWIAESYPECSKVELFARKEDLLFDADGFEGWDVWGNECKSDIELQVVKI